MEKISFLEWLRQKGNKNFGGLILQMCVLLIFIIGLITSADDVSLFWKIFMWVFMILWGCLAWYRVYSIYRKVILKK